MPTTIASCPSEMSEEHLFWGFTVLLLPSCRATLLLPLPLVSLDASCRSVWQHKVGQHCVREATAHSDTNLVLDSSRCPYLCRSICTVLFALSFFYSLLHSFVRSFVVSPLSVLSHRWPCVAGVVASVPFIPLLRRDQRFTRVGHASGRAGPQAPPLLAPASRQPAPGSSCEGRRAACASPALPWKEGGVCRGSTPAPLLLLARARARAPMQRGRRPGAC
mmetsp:Transcript_4198/g.14802  ORF Transcript_4198/g.14802 Transcript_4198/m.14802 type:complete len:220 (+) Transcript_4198:75-734(+)